MRGRTTVPPQRAIGNTTTAPTPWGRVLLQGAFGGAYSALATTAAGRRFGRNPRHDWMTVGSIALRDQGIVPSPGIRHVATGLAVHQVADLGWAALWWGGVVRGLDRPQQRTAFLAAGLPWALGTAAVERWAILPWLRPMVKDEIPLSVQMTSRILSTLTYPVLFLLDPSDDPTERHQDRRLALGTLSVMGGALMGLAVVEGLRKIGVRPPRGDAGQQAADERFVRRMAAHQDNGVALARLAATHADQAELQTLGRQMEGEQLDERHVLQEWWRDRMGGDVPKPAPNERRGTAGTVPPIELERLRGLTGRHFELAYLPVLINHHKGAIRMCDRVRQDGKDPALKALARTISYARKTQIAAMERLLETARPVEEESTGVRVTERLRVARGRTPRRTLTGKLLDASRKIPLLLSPSPSTPRRTRQTEVAPAPRTSPTDAAQTLNRVAGTIVHLRRGPGPERGDGRNDRQKGREGIDKA